MLHVITVINVKYAILCAVFASSAFILIDYC